MISSRRNPDSETMTWIRPSAGGSGQSLLTSSSARSEVHQPEVGAGNQLAVEQLAQREPLAASRPRSSRGIQSSPAWSRSARSPNARKLDRGATSPLLGEV